MKKTISRKEFIAKTAAGAAAVCLLPVNISGDDITGMPLRPLGKTGINVTPLCFGASGTIEESLIKYAIAAGINYIDTAHSYSNGNNERLVGRALSEIRKEIIIQTKIRLAASELPSGGKGIKGAGEIRTLLFSKLDASLKALNTSYIDILLYHDAIDEKLLFHNEVMRFFEEKKKEGLIKAYGFSAENDNMKLLLRNSSDAFYNVVMIPFNQNGSFIHSHSGPQPGWDQNKLISILTEANEKGTGIVAMKTFSGLQYSDADYSFENKMESLKWVLQHKFVTAVEAPILNMEDIDKYSSSIKTYIKP